MAELFSPTNIILVAIIISIIVIAGLFMKKKKGLLPKFRPKLFGHSNYDDMKEKLDLHGVKPKMVLFRPSRLYLGFNGIAIIEKFMYITGKLPYWSWDNKEREIIIEEDKKDAAPYKFLLLRCKNNNLILRLLGLKKVFFILNTDRKGEKENIDFDKKERKIFLPVGTDLKSYGNVWTNSEIGMEYINEMSILRMLQQIMTHVENTPDRVIHLDNAVAKNERLARTLSEIERAKYEKTKTADETIIS